MFQMDKNLERERERAHTLQSLLRTYKDIYLISLFYVIKDYVCISCLDIFFVSNTRYIPWNIIQTLRINGVDDLLIHMHAYCCS